jgi:hypothetical protein
MAQVESSGMTLVGVGASVKLTAPNPTELASQI